MLLPAVVLKPAEPCRTPQVACCKHDERVRMSAQVHGCNIRRKNKSARKARPTSVRFSNRAFGSSTFLIVVGLIVHAGHASLRSLLAPLRLEPLHACMGSGSGKPLWDALEAQRTQTALSIPSSAWDDPAGIGFEGCVKSCCSLRSEPELGTIDPHAMEHGGLKLGDCSP